MSLKYGRNEDFWSKSRGVFYQILEPLYYGENM